MTMSHPQSYEILIVPEFTDDRAPGTGNGATGASVRGAAAKGSRGWSPGAAVRSAVVTATGETGETGYPRYAGDGMVADIDPRTRAVEGLLVDGSELAYGLAARVTERDANG
ncbi:hypothetical protein K388_04218 [Streptomyces sp. KhCrAH-43]|uniref:hypothetical protein n=1 Tax=Streptomyces TaxID=1883 RepID=UPI000370DE37|nr:MULTISPECIES: hypothetical protein [unclassified Streptomyces]MYS33051.1 hypothetical protein [Streptomyces sp. SID4920]MYX67750.1 hypothetical protein [Streptomyces sp. SID8373]RAJ58157.1 hypothetical protein K388_04218 [Streptomyces sp. KhCrAH-43]